MFRSVVVILLLFATVNSFGQNASLIRKLRKDLRSSNEQQQYEILTQLAWEYRASHPDSGIYFGLKAHALGLKLGRNDTAKPLNFTGLAYNHKGNHLDAYDYYTRALETAQNDQDSLQIAHACNNLGRLCMEQGLLTRAHGYLNRSKTIFDRLNDYPSLAYVYQSLAAYDMALKNQSKAEFNYKKAYEIRLKTKNATELLSAIIQLGKFYMGNDQLDLALRYFHMADSVGYILNDELFLAEIKTHKSQCELQRGNLLEAERLAGEGIRTIEKSGNLRLLPDAYLTMGQIQFKKENLPEAREYFNRMLKVSALRKDLKARMEAYFFLWQTFKKQNNESQEMDHYTQYLELRDSVRTLESEQRESQLRFHLEIEKKEKENEILNMRSRQKTAVILVMALILVLILIILYTQIKFRRKIVRINRLLEDRNREIKTFNNILNDKKVTLERHIVSLVELSKNRSVQVGNLGYATRDIVAIAARNLHVSQVSIWIYDEEKQCIETIACYNSESDTYPPDIKLSFSDAPKYFEAIKKEKIIIVDDARSHPFTDEFTEGYFVPNNIYSLMDVTFYLDGKLKGLLCCEHQNSIKHWTAEDKIFASSVADVITLAFRTSQRFEYEMHIKDQNREIAHMNEMLEQRVRQRTEELEDQNKKLMEYAFINSHVLRGPVSRILGLISLFEHAKTMEVSEIVGLLRKSGEELDTVVKKITEALNQGSHISKEDFD